MEFSVPQFIERETRIVGPLTIKQFVIIGIAGGFAFILYFTVPFFYFILATIFLVGISFSLAFLKVGGVPMLTYLKNFLMFNAVGRIYVWKKAELPLFKMVERKKAPEKEKKAEESPLKVEGEGELSKLRRGIELNR